MRKSRLLITTYYLQVSLHDMKLKLTLEMLFDKESESILHQLGQTTFSENVLWF